MCYRFTLRDVKVVLLFFFSLNDFRLYFEDCSIAILASLQLQGNNHVLRSCAFFTHTFTHVHAWGISEAPHNLLTLPFQIYRILYLY